MQWVALTLFMRAPGAPPCILHAASCPSSAQVTNFLFMRHPGLKIHFRVWGIVLRKPYPFWGNGPKIKNVPAGSCLSAAGGVDICGDTLINSFRKQWRDNSCAGRGGGLWILRQLYNTLPEKKQGIIALFSGRGTTCGGPAGIAYVNGICSGAFKFSAMRGDLPSVSMMAALVAHEFGHLMDGRHSQNLPVCGDPIGPKWIMSQVLGLPPDHRFCWANVQRMEVATRRSCVVRTANCINCQFASPTAHQVQPNGLPLWSSWNSAQRAAYKQGFCAFMPPVPAYLAKRESTSFSLGSSQLAAAVPNTTSSSTAAAKKRSGAP